MLLKILMVLDILVAYVEKDLGWKRDIAKDT